MKKSALIISILGGVAAMYIISRAIKPKEPQDEIKSENNDGDFLPELNLGGFSAPKFLEPVGDFILTVKNNVFGTRYDALINSGAVANGIPPEVLYKLLRQESRFRPDIIEGRTKSPTGALGIAQFMPATAIEWLGSVEAALDPAKAIPGAARYLAWLQTKFGGDLTKAVAAYNWGIGNVQRKGLASAPKETRDYAMAILGVSIA